MIDKTVSNLKVLWWGGGDADLQYSRYDTWHIMYVLFKDTCFCHNVIKG